MAVFCCCTTPRSSKARHATAKENPKLPTPPPPARLPGPLTLNPVVPVFVGISPNSPNSPSSTLPSVPATIVPIDPVELGQLVVEDSDSDDELESRPQNKSTSTLQLVRTHIRRHLSQDSLSRRKARSAVGSSHEEIERRAELKRLMHKRIQEELRTEEDQEVTQSDISSSHHRHGPSLEVLPGGGPRDNLEFSVTEDSGLDTHCASHVGTDASTSLLRDISSDSNEASLPEERRASCPEILPRPVGQTLVRERSSLPQMPLSPDFLPARTPSTDETSSSIRSLRLSYSAGQLDELLGYPDRGYSFRDDSSIQRAPLSPMSANPTTPSCRMPFPPRSHSLSRSYSTPGRQATPAPVNERRSRSIQDQSPLSTWLRSQGLRSTSPSCSGLRTSEDEQGSIKEAEVVYLRRCSSVQHYAVSETDLPRPEIVHLYDMDIHRQLATRAFNTPERSTSQSTSIVSGGLGGPSREYSSSDTGGKKSSATNKLRERHETPEANMPNTAPTWIATNSSSVYPSVASSVEPTPAVSSYHIPGWTIGGKYPLAFTMPDFKWFENLGNPHLQNQSSGSSPVTTGGNSSASVAGPDTGAQTRLTSPFLPSPTPSSGAPRETKIDILEKSMGRFRLGYGAPSAIISRFQKTNDDSETHTESQKPSLLARLHLTLPRRVKLASRGLETSGSDGQHSLPTLSGNRLFIENLDRPVSRVTEKSDLSYVSHSPGLGKEGSAKEIWQKAICTEARQRTSSVCHHENHNRRSSFPDEDIYNKSKTMVLSLKHHSSSLAGCSGVDNAGHGCDQSPTIPAPTSIRGADSVLSPKNNDAVPCSLPVNSQVQGGNMPKVLDSWARFPSHNRAERNGAAGQTNTVSATGFAVTPLSKHTAGKVSMDTSAESPEQTPKHSSRAVPGKFGKAVRSGFSKLLPSRASPGPSSPKSSKNARKSSDRYKRSLEYPELELQPTPGGYQELKALEQEIESLKCSPRTWIPAALQDKGKVALSAKMAALLHTDGPNELLTPVRPPPSHSRGSTTTTDRFVTPLSSMSTSHDNSSFHSYPRSRPHSRTTMPFYGEVVAEAGSDRDSVKSDTALGKVLYSRTTSDVDSGFCGSTTCAPKFETLSGRSRTHPFLTAHTMEQLDGMDESCQRTAAKRVSLRDVGGGVLARSGVAVSDSVASF